MHFLIYFFVAYTFYFLINFGSFILLQFTTTLSMLNIFTCHIQLKGQDLAMISLTILKTDTWLKCDQQNCPNWVHVE